MPPASSPRCGRSAPAAWSLTTATNIHDVAASAEPAPPESEQRLWYQYYFHGERGRAGLTKNRRALCRLLWRLWSPTWAFDDATFERSAAAFDNPDFVDVVIHSYRQRYGLVPGDPALERIEQSAGSPAQYPRAVDHARWCDRTASAPPEQRGKGRISPDRASIA